MDFVEIKYQPARSRVYLGSPSLVRLSDGTLLCSHDYFGELKTLEGENGLTSIYRSEDEGQTWENITHIIHAFWGNLFTCGDTVYLISTTRDHGDIVIRRSTDGGFTWSVPAPDCGILLSSHQDPQSPACRIETSGSSFICDGRIYKAYDLFTYKRTSPEPDAPMISWTPANFSACVMSAPLDSNLLNPDSWTHSNPVPFDERLFKQSPDCFKPGCGWLEGTLVKAPDGTLADISRVHSYGLNKAAYMTLSSDGATLAFDYRNGILDFPASPSRFTIQQDPKTGLYVTFSNPQRELAPGLLSSRNILTMCVSEDLRCWREVKDVITDDSGLPPDQSVELTGFQYNSWLFDGDDVILLSRMSYRGAHTFHDSNRIGFFRFRNFRDWL